MKISSPEEYVEAQPAEYRDHLEDMRKIIKRTIPVAEELISYQVICYRYIYMLVGIGIKKGYISFYSMSPFLVKKLKTSLMGIKYTESTIYFPLNKKLPEELITEIVQERIIENEQKAHFNGKL